MSGYAAAGQSRPRVRFDPNPSFRAVSPASSESDSTESTGPPTPPTPPFIDLPSSNNTTPNPSPYRSVPLPPVPQVYTPSPIGNNLSPSHLFPGLPPSHASANNAYVPAYPLSASSSSSSYAPSSPYLLPQGSVPVALNPVLESQTLPFDLSVRPSHQNLALPNSALAGPATYPPLPLITLACPDLPWNIQISPSPSASPNSAQYVTVQDVLDTLYSKMRTPVKGEEFRTLGPVREREVREAFERRCRRGGGEVERSKGVKRVDFLGGRTRWAGVRRIDGGKEGDFRFWVQ